jgi:hypothetical protein
VSESLKNISVGLLAYGAIGDEHSKAIRAVDGLRLTAVADTNSDRLAAAKELAPDVTCPCILVQALAINSGAPMYPILHPVMANALATPFTVIVLSNIPGIDAMLQNVPEKLICS